MKLLKTVEMYVNLELRSSILQDQITRVKTSMLWASMVPLVTTDLLILLTAFTKFTAIFSLN